MYNLILRRSEDNFFSYIFLDTLHNLIKMILRKNFSCKYFWAPYTKLIRNCGAPARSSAVTFPLSDFNLQFCKLKRPFVGKFYQTFFRLLAFFRNALRKMSVQQHPRIADFYAGCSDESPLFKSDIYVNRLPRSLNIMWLIKVR